MADPMDGVAAALADRYRIDHELGRGGMATVYLAEDLKHRRKVAIKVLHAELSAIVGPERFLKEIELTASLQHPHILPLFDSGSAGGLLYYVMPYVEGETLRDRLVREKQLPIIDAVRIATEVADALAYAHDRRVIHRDVKPENILLRDGHALVADFGIALAVEHAGGERMTQTGMSLGTPQYMSPEQATGEREITARSDVWALGIVTYEMLTGEPPFTGSTGQAVVAKMITDDPAPPSRHRRTVPPHVDSAVLTALEKLPADRFASAKDFAAALSDSHSASRPGHGARMRRDRFWRATPIVAFLSLAALVASGWSLLRPAQRVHPLRASLLPPPGCSFASVATANLVQLAPDGESLAFVASCGTDESLWIRSLVTGALRKLPGTAHAAYPFWSPDGTSLGFFADGRLKRIDLESNAVRELAPAVNGRGGTWSRHDDILYAPDISGPLYWIPASGGAPRPATSVSSESAATISHRLPYFLPDGEHFLFTDSRLNSRVGTVRVGTLGSAETRVLLDVLTNVVAARGQLLYADAGLLMVRPFDSRTATFSGPAVSVVPGVESWAFRYLGNFTVSASGDVMVYRPAPVERNRIEWFDPRTSTAATLLEPGRYLHARLARDGRHLLVEQREADKSLNVLSLYDITARSWNPVDSRPAVYYTFGWSPDAAQIAYNGSNSDGRGVVSIVSIDGTVRQRFLAHGWTDVMDWSPEATSLITVGQRGGSGWDIATTRLADTASHALLGTTADESGPRISPDGHMLAYVSNETGRAEVYVTRMPEATARWRLSENGVWVEPAAHRAPLAWSRGGTTVYFADGAGRLMSVSVEDGATVRIGRPAPVPGAPANIIDLDASADGRLILIVSESPEETPLELIEHWPAMAKQAK